MIDDKKIGQGLIDGLRASMRTFKRNASGDASKSLRWVNSGTEILVFGSDYWKYIDKGRRSGKMPPFNKIFTWVAVKLGLQGREQNNATWGIMKNIAKKGAPKDKTSLGMVQRNLEANKAMITEEVNRFQLDQLKEMIKL